LPELVWLGRIGFGILGVALVLVAAIAFSVIIVKFRAEYLVDAASLETIRGTAADVRHIVWTDPSARFPRFTLAGGPIRFAPSRLIALSDGDEVVIAGQPSTGAFVARAMQNITQARFERGWDRWSQFETLLIAIFGLAAPAGFFVSTPTELNPFIALRYMLIVAVACFAAIALIARFYAWKLDRQTALGYLSPTQFEDQRIRKKTAA
jgi:hypothetical protein